MAENIEVQALTPDQIDKRNAVSQKNSEITDKFGEKYQVTFLKSSDDTLNVIDSSEAQKLLPDLIALSKEGFPDIDETNIHDKFTGYNALDIVKAADGTAVGYHVYKFTELQDPEPAKVMFTSYAVISQSHNGRNLTEISRMPAIDIENPDILAGSTNVPAIYRTNRNIAEARGMIMYPVDTETPESIVLLGRKVLNTVVKSPPPPDAPPLIADNLVRTRRERSPEDQNIPFFDPIVPIGPHQQLVYMVINPALNQRILAR